MAGRGAEYMTGVPSGPHPDVALQKKVVELEERNASLEAAVAELSKLNTILIEENRELQWSRG